MRPRGGATMGRGRQAWCSFAPRFSWCSGLSGLRGRVSRVARVCISQEKKRSYRTWRRDMRHLHMLYQTLRTEERSSPTHRRILQPPSSSQILVTPLEKERKKRGEAGSSAPLPSSARLHSGGWRHTRVLPPSTHQRRGESLSHFLLPPPLREDVALRHPPTIRPQRERRTTFALFAPSSPQ